MQKQFLPEAEGYARNNIRRRIWRRFVRVMACIVVFCTTYALILPAITLERRSICEVEEHVHSDSCYSKLTSQEILSLQCNHDSLQVHTHTADCFGADGQLCCGMADFVVHEHNSYCYDPEGALVCTLPVIRLHSHTEACYPPEETAEEPQHEHGEECYIKELGELTCTQTVTEGHSHNDGCYSPGETLTCGLEESEGHTHGDGCKETVLVCDMTVEPHVHTDGCYTQQVCEIPEDENHTHSESCSGKVLACDLTEQPHTHGDACYQIHDICSLEESEGHAHTDACYAPVLSCGQEEVAAHAHTDECYAVEEVLICELEESQEEAEEATEPEPAEEIPQEPICQEQEIVLHTHADGCYEITADDAGNEVRTLICEALEVREHIHDKSCFVTETVEVDTENLTCTLPGLHVHGEGCYDENGELICTEPTQTHVHGEGCYDEAGALICTESEEAHVHTDMCYGTWVLSCGQEEHTHTEACLVTYYCSYEEHSHAEKCVDAEGNVICELPEHTHAEECLVPVYYCELEEHSHAEECVDEAGNLICETEEHEHTDICVQNITATEREAYKHYAAIMEVASLDEVAELLDNIEDDHLLAMPDDMILDIAEHIADITTPETEELEMQLMERLMKLRPVAFGLPEVLIPEGYICFDLFYGDVKLTDASYEGYVYDGTGQPKFVTGSHEAGNKYYIFQSKGEALEGIPTYSRVTYNGQRWGDYITNNTNVVGVINAWKTAARAVGRSETPAEMKLNDNIVSGNPDVTVRMHHRISIESSSSVTTSFDVTIDNVWSGFQNDDCADASGNFYMGDEINDGPHYRTSGGLSFRPGNKSTVAYIRLVGDNRFGNVHYDVGGGAGGSTDSSEIDRRIRQMFFINADNPANPGTLTVANLDGDNGYNHFCSVIGGANNPDYVPGLVFQSGIIYAGSTTLDNCTAIGGGGCGFGGITIEGGTITAVASTNGAAIGGGIGDGSNGGATDIYISGGRVYAYNKGLAIEGTRESRGQAGTTGGETVYVVMPAVAIGSGSSRRQWTVPAKIEITGGTVYAQSVGGTAIGAGSSNNYDAADATINITGGTVTAKSVAGQVDAIHEYDRGQFPTYVGRKENVSASNSIGGGTAGIPFRYEGAMLFAQGNGGDCILNISGGARIYAGSIGGGGVSDIRNSTDTAPRPDTVGKIGAAHVSISSGTVQGQVIMAAGANEDCSFTMTGGTIDNGTKTDDFTFLKENGGAVYVENGIASISAGSITRSSAKLGGAIYVSNGSLEMTGGEISQCSAVDGGAICVTGGNVTITNGTLTENTASGNGGAVYVNNASVTFGSNTGMIEVSDNTAINGAGFYLDQSGGSYTTIISNGQITDNTASGNGGGIFQMGTGAVCTVSGDGSVSNNTAVNGGGFYIDSGAMNVNGGYVVSNKAVGTTTNTTAYTSGTNNGVGGGIYLNGGTFTMTAASENVGLYGNLADFAADDVYAAPTGTTLTIPEVAKMNLTNFGHKVGTVTDWFEDYATADTRYENGLKGGSYANGSSGIMRYRLADNDHKVSNKATAISNKYTCLTLGYEMDYTPITVEKIVSNYDGTPVTDQKFLFKIAYNDGIHGIVTKQFSIGHQEEQEIKDILSNSSFTVTELNPDGYIVSVETKDSEGTVLAAQMGSAVTADNGQARRITFTNVAGYELPETGGAGITSYTMGGLLIMIAAAILLYIHSNKRRKEERPSF